ncbi:MAG: lytic transglycosylase domain-containing protein [Deltaproteobacteria bacterium]|nr:lytic transglycosylase domain-containing protein [Deltaproteobacteria bacterium]
MIGARLRAAALAWALAFCLPVWSAPEAALAQGGLFAPDEQIPPAPGSQGAPAEEPAEEYTLPDWVPRYPNSNRPYWLPPEDGPTTTVPPTGSPSGTPGGTAPATDSGGLFAPPPPTPPPPPAATQPATAPAAAKDDKPGFEGEVLQYYMFTDDQGVTHLTDAPADPRYRLFTIAISVTSDKAPYRRLNLERIMPYIQKASNTYKVDQALITAVIRSESAFDPNAVSWVGARGLMQLMPNTARMMGVKDSFDPEQNIMGGTRYLRMMLNRFNGDVILAVAAYNCGPERVARVMAVPNIRETKNYVRTVLRNYDTFLRMFRAEASGQAADPPAAGTAGPTGTSGSSVPSGSTGPAGPTGTPGP